MTINDLIAHYASRKILNSSLSPGLEEKLGHLKRVFGPMPATASGQEIVEKSLAAWPSAAPGTRKRYLVQLRAVLNRAERDGVIARAPLIDLPFVHDTVYIDINGREANLLLDYIKWTEHKWYPLTLVLMHTGARLGEALSLTERSFIPGAGTRIGKPVGRRSKTIDRVIPFTPRMRAAVDSGELTRRGSLIPDGIAAGSVAACLGRVIDSSIKALGLPPMRVHDLRHAFAGVLADNGADLADISVALGHTNPAMALRYRGRVKSRLNSIMERV
jgi:integrase